MISETETLDREESAEATEKQRALEQQWSHMMCELDRAVAWVKDNKEGLKTISHISLWIDSPHGVEIDLGCMFASSSDYADKRKALRSLFLGKKVTRIFNECDRTETFRLKDDGLSFEWRVYRKKSCERTETEITL